MKETHVECAGAGKTFGIAEKIVRLLDGCPCGQKIYAITYTNYAVSQINEEIIKRVDHVPVEVAVSTVHSFLLEHIIYPFSSFVRSVPINSCSIEKLDSNERWKARRKRLLKEKGILHSDDVTTYAKSLIIPLSSDNKAIKQRKEIALQYLCSDIFALFVDEAQDMDKDFFDLMRILVSQLNNYCFVGDPNQDLWGRNQYSAFLSYVSETYSIAPIYNLVSRRLPQSIIPICNGILNSAFQISSCNDQIGAVGYVYASELCDAERKLLSNHKTFSMIKEKRGIFTTKPEKAIALPYEFKEILSDRFVNHDLDAISMMATNSIKRKGLSSFLSHYGLHISKEIYAKVSQQFSVVDSGYVSVRSIHNLKGLESNSVYFIVCNSLLEILLGLKNDYNKETNLLYVALTRTKDRLLLIILDDDGMKRSFNQHGVCIDEGLAKIGIQHLNTHEWFSS